MYNLFATKKNKVHELILVIETVIQIGINLINVDIKKICFRKRKLFKNEKGKFTKRSRRFPDRRKGE